MGDRLHLQDCKCPICMCILIEPVRLPCEHELCMPCFRQNVEEAHFTCPICRLRISSWARKHSRHNQLVDKKRWKQIQEAFPLLCQKRIDGEDEDSEYEAVSPVKRNVLVAEPGEIRKEYEEEKTKFIKIRQEEEKISIEQSEELIKRLQREEIQKYEEEKKALEAQQHKDEELAKCLASKLEEEEELTIQHEQTSGDEELARRLQQEEEQVVSPKSTSIVNISGPSTSSQKGPSSSMKCSRLEHLFIKMKKSQIVPRESPSQDSVGSSTSQPIAFGAFSPTDAILPSMESVGVFIQRTKSTESEDSITNEVCHFKPIVRSPRTAHKKLADGSRESPPIIHSTPRNLSNLRDGSGKLAAATKSKLIEMLPKNIPESPSCVDAKTRKDEEVQASLERAPKELIRGCSRKQLESGEPTIPNGKENSDKRRFEIRSKLSRFSRKVMDDSESESEYNGITLGKDERLYNNNNMKKIENHRDNHAKRKKKDLHRLRELSENGERKTSVEISNPRKKCKSEVRKDKNCNVVIVDVGTEDELCGNREKIPSRVSCEGDNRFNLEMAEVSDKKDKRHSENGPRKSNGQNTIVRYMELQSEEQMRLKQEDIDRKVALELQKQFEEESKTDGSPIVRTKGSKDEYPLRANRKRLFREVSHGPQG